MVELKKSETHLQQLSQKYNAPLIDQTPSRISTIVQPVPVIKKIDSRPI